MTMDNFTVLSEANSSGSSPGPLNKRQKKFNNKYHNNGRRYHNFKTPSGGRTKKRKFGTSHGHSNVRPPTPIPSFSDKDSNQSFENNIFSFRPSGLRTTTTNANVTLPPIPSTPMELASSSCTTVTPAEVMFVAPRQNTPPLFDPGLIPLSDQMPLHFGTFDDGLIPVEDNFMSTEGTSNELPFRVDYSNFLDI
jgi:hypothetical protein